MIKKHVLSFLLCFVLIFSSGIHFSLVAGERQPLSNERKVVYFHEAERAMLFQSQLDLIAYEESLDYEIFNDLQAVSLPYTDSVKNLLMDFYHDIIIVDDFTFSSYPLEPFEHTPALIDENWNLEITGAPELWKKGYTGKGIKIAILDTGIDANHEAFKGRVVDFAEFSQFGGIYRGDPATAYDSHYHGSHVAGIAAGSAPNHAVGIAPEALLSAGIVIPRGGGTMSQIIGGLEWTLDPDGDPDTDDQPDIVNLSLGMPGFIKIWTPVFDRLLEKNIFPVAAIGNDGDGICGSPGSTPNVFSVGAFDRNIRSARFSSGGDQLIWEDEYVQKKYFTKPEISAPGVSIFSAIPGNNYARASGTSMSSPHVAGAAALLMEAFPSATAWDVWFYLIEGADDHGNPGHDSRYGSGSLNLVGSYELMKQSSLLKGTIEGDFENCRIINRKKDLPLYIDKQGNFTSMLLPGSHTFDVYYRGQHYRQVNLRVVNQEHMLQIEVPPSKEVQFRGIVSDPSGNPLQARIKSSSSKWQTGRDGRFNIEIEVHEPITIRSSGYVETTLFPGTNDEYHNIRLKRADLLLIEGYSVYLTSINPPRLTQQYYMESLKALGKKTAFLDAGSEKYTYEDIKDYPLIIYYCDSGTISRDEYSAIAEYIRNGGRIIFSGRILLHVEGQLRQNFLSSLFGVSSREYLVFPSVIGLEETKDSAHLHFALSGNEGANNQETCDVIFYPGNVVFVEPFLRYTDVTGNRFAGLRRADGISKAILLSFGIEGIGSSSQRTALMKNLLDWMDDSKTLHVDLPDNETFYLNILSEDNHQRNVEITKGTFVLRNLKPQFYTFRIEGYGYKPYTLSIDFAKHDYFHIRKVPQKSPLYAVNFKFEEGDDWEGIYQLKYKGKALMLAKHAFDKTLTLHLPIGEYSMLFTGKGMSPVVKEFEVKEGDLVFTTPLAEHSRKVLILDNSKMGAYFRDERIQEEYGKLLQTHQIGYDVWDILTKGNPEFIDLLAYELVICITGYNVFAFEEEDIYTALAQYLDHNGSMVFMGNASFIALRDQPFFSEYIGLSVASSNIRERTIFSGGTPWFDNLQFDLYIPFNQGPPRFPSFEAKSHNVHGLFYYVNSKGLCGTAHLHDQYTVAFFPFGLENIIVPSVRQQFMNGVLKIFEFSP